MNLATPRRVIEFDAFTGEPRRSFTNAPAIVAVAYHESPANNGTLQVLKHDRIVTLNLMLGRFTEALPPFQSDSRLSHLSGAALSADGRHWWLSSKQAVNSCDGLVLPALFRTDFPTGEFRQLAGPMRNPTNAWVYVSIPHPYVEPAPWLISADGGGRIFVSSLTPGTVSVFRADGEKPVREIAVPHTPVLMECAANGRLVTVATNELAVTDAETGTLLHRVPLAGKPTGSAWMRRARTRLSPAKVRTRCKWWICRRDESPAASKLFARWALTLRMRRVGAACAASFTSAGRTNRAG